MPSSPVTRSSDHFVAPIDETPVVAIDPVDDNARARSVWTDAWQAMRRRPEFWISSILIVFIVVVALFPTLFTQTSPNTGCDLSDSNGPARAGHPLGFTNQGCDIYARIIFGAQASLTVGLLATILVATFGLVVGALAGYFGGILDAIVSRLGDIFFAIPTVLAAIVLFSVFRDRSPVTIALVLAAFAWPQVARIMRGAVVSAKQNDYVMASTALGVSRFRILLRHVIPNAIGPVIVIATVSLGTFIVAEATLSFLGIGLGEGIMSWGNDIDEARTGLRTDPQVLFFPAAALSLCVLSFLMLGDVVRDALDPRARARR